MPKKPHPRNGLPAYASNIRRLLRERDITHVAYSKKVGLSPQSMYAALNGGDIKTSTLLRMATALNVPPYTLLLTEADAASLRPAEAAAPQPNFLSLLGALAGGPTPTPQVPVAAQDFLSNWSKLSARDIASLTQLARQLAHNSVVDATYRGAEIDVASLVLEGEGRETRQGNLPDGVSLRRASDRAGHHAVR